MSDEKNTDTPATPIEPDETKSNRNSRSSSTPPEKVSPIPLTSSETFQRPISPVHGHRTNKKPMILKQRQRSNSPQKMTFSVMNKDRVNQRMWRERRREMAKEEENARIYMENRKILERLTKIAKEPSSYPSINLEQEHLRDRHIADYRRKLLKSYIPILRENLSIVNRLANVKGVYDRDRMEADFQRHSQIIRQDAVNRQKARETAANQRPFLLPKINVKS